MTKILLRIMAVTSISLVWAVGLQAQEIIPMFGAWMTDGYDLGGKPIGPKGSFAYHADTNVIKGKYLGLKMPKGRKTVVAWLHDTVNQKSIYVGTVGWLKVGTGGREKAVFTIKLPDQFKGGDFGSYEILAFSAESTKSFNGKKAVSIPNTLRQARSCRRKTRPFICSGRCPGRTRN